MSNNKRYLASLLLGFVAYRVGVEFIIGYAAVAVGLALAVATWLLTAPRSAAKPPSDDQPSDR